MTSSPGPAAWVSTPTVTGAVRNENEGKMMPLGASPSTKSQSASKTQQGPMSPPLAMDLHEDHPFVCNICKRSYTRIDHLARHFRSHTRETPFQCSSCGKDFARVDLLKRHMVKHKSHQAVPGAQHTPRVSQACVACATSKLKCGPERPCRRCVRKEIECATPISKSRRSNRLSTVTSASEAPSENVSEGIERSSAEASIQNVVNLNLSRGERPSISAAELSESTTETPSWALTSSPLHDRVSALQNPASSSPWNSSVSLSSVDVDMSPNLETSSFADFLKEILGTSLSDTSAQPEGVVLHHSSTSRDVFNFAIQDDLGLDEMDYGWIDAFDQNPFHSFDGTNSNPRNKPSMEYPKQNRNIQSGADMGAEAFEKSLWRWAPGQQDNGYAEQLDLSLPLGSVGNRSRLSMETSRHQLEQRPRDKILAMVLGTCPPANVSRVLDFFPSAEMLNDLMQDFLEQQRLSIEAWIHIPTFNPMEQIPELNAAVVAAGATLSTNPAVRRLGYAIQESVRMVMRILLNNDNSQTRNLQVVQTFALQLVIGIWSGHKRKMELAESSYQALITMLRRGDRYRRAMVRPGAPASVDDEQTLTEKWHRWVEAESFKRLAFYSLIHDTRCSIALLVRPLIRCTEVTLEVPCSQTLWCAPDARSWRDAYLAVSSAADDRVPGLSQCVYDFRLLAKVWSQADVQLSLLLFLHVIWDRIMEYQQLEQVAGLLPLDSQHEGNLVLSHVHKDLCQHLYRFDLIASKFEGELSHEIVLFKELLSMNLYLSFQDIQLFAGKDGVEEAQRVYPLLRSWVGSRQSRQAVWHAGQVIRAAILCDLRHFNAIALYHASLTLWVYGMISCGDQSKLVQRVDGITDYVWLNAEETSAVQSFIAIGHGTPSIHGLLNEGEATSTTACLSNPKAVIDIVISILMKGSGESASPLMENLGQLMRDLGDAAWAVGCYLTPYERS